MVRCKGSVIGYVCIQCSTVHQVIRRVPIAGRAAMTQGIVDHLAPQDHSGQRVFVPQGLCGRGQYVVKISVQFLGPVFDQAGGGGQIRPVQKKHQRLMHIFKGLRLRLGGFLCLDIVEIGQKLEVVAQQFRLQRFGKARHAVGLRIVHPAKCEKAGDIGCVPVRPSCRSAREVRLRQRIKRLLCPPLRQQ